MEECLMKIRSLFARHHQQVEDEHKIRRCAFSLENGYRCGNQLDQVEDEHKIRRCAFLLENGYRCGNQLDTETLGEFCKQHAQAADLEAYRAVTAHFRHDLQVYWQRSSLYLLVQGGLVTIFVALFNSVTDRPLNNLITSFFIAVLGLILALMWFDVTLSSHVWIEAWRDEVIRLDEAINRFHTYKRICDCDSWNYSSNIPGHRLIARKMNPETVTHFLPLTLSIGWFVVIILLTLYSLGLHPFGL